MKLKWCDVHGGSLVNKKLADLFFIFLLKFIESAKILGVHGGVLGAI